LLEWGHSKEALAYIGWYLQHNIVKGHIDYKNFGCDSDADIGRTIDLYARAVRYSENSTWALVWLPTIEAMATDVLVRRTKALAAFPAGNPLHGIVPGSPEHDICHDPSYFFSIQVWYVRGLLSLDGVLRGESADPALAAAANATLVELLEPTAAAWRVDIRFAANFTAVRRTIAPGSKIAPGDTPFFFLHPVVGSVYSLRTSKSPPLLEGGDETTCVERGTCFASMTAALPGGKGGSNQHTNYANFRIM
jgi:hypothetical protein